MNRGQLRDIIKFEAGLKDSDNFDAWVNETIQDTLASLTALIRYPELKTPDHQVVLTGATQLVTVPKFQHILLDEIYYLPAGEGDQAYHLFSSFDNHLVNEGRALSIIRRSATQLSLFPFGDIVGTDKIQFTYWAYPTLANDATEIPVENLVPTLRSEVVAKASLHTESKTFAAHRALAREAHSRSFGATDVNDEP